MACNKNDDNLDPIVINHEIVGKWQTVAFREDVAPFEWQSVNGGITEFRLDGSLIVTPDESSCDTRTYEILIIEEADDHLLNYCDGELNSSLPFELTDSDELIVKLLLVHYKSIRVLESN